MQHATLADAVPNGIDLGTNAFLLIHGWTTVRLLLDFSAKFQQPLARKPMTLAELASETGAEDGPLALVLRTCRILGYVKPDVNLAEHSQHTQYTQYTLDSETELTELMSLLNSGSQVAKALQAMYAEVAPPFEIASEDAGRCLELWENHRPAWAKSRSKTLGSLLDGAVLAPLLASIAYFARWDAQGMETGGVVEEMDFSKVDPAMRVSLGDVFEQTGVGTINAKGTITLSSQATLALQRCYSFFAPISYAPMLAQFSTVLFEDVGWGFLDVEQDSFDVEEHLDRTLNVVGCSATQHQSFFKDFMRHIDRVFKGQDYRAQPRFVVDTGCGDGSLLLQIYQHIKESLPRGKVLKEHPLTMVGVDLNEEPRVKTAVTLSRAGVPHMVVSGNVGRPAEIAAALKRKKIDVSLALHVRSFADHVRPFTPPAVKLEEHSAAGQFADAQLADDVHLDKAGQRLDPRTVFASLVDHFQRWATVLQRSPHGLCTLEAMMLDVETTRKWANDSIALSADIVQCLSRQYMVSAPVYLMAAAMSGVMPADHRATIAYPEHKKYCRVLSQRLVAKPYKIRLAELSDLGNLLELEELSWAQPMRASADVLKRRLETSPLTNLVCEMEGKVVAVLYIQRIAEFDVLRRYKFMDIPSAHRLGGRMFQLVAAASHPEHAALGLGDALKSFALMLARVDYTVDAVVAVTRCGEGFQTYEKGDMKEYVREHFAGSLVDNVLAFHSESGAKFVGVVEGYRPEDTDNKGAGVLVIYNIKGVFNEPKKKKAKPLSHMSTLEVVLRLIREVGLTPPKDHEETSKTFYELGMDSVHLVRMRNRLSEMLMVDFPSTLLIDFPTVKGLVEHLISERKTRLEEKKKEKHVQAVKKNWETVGVSELIEIQRRINKSCAEPVNQDRFMRLAKKCYPDQLKYNLAVSAFLASLEGEILMECGIIEDLQHETVRASQRAMNACTLRHWKANPAVKTEYRTMLHLTKQDQKWSPNQ